MFIIQVLTIGLVSSIILTIIVFASLAYNPRLWISDMPKGMQEAITPLAPREKRDRLLWAIPLLLVMFVYPVYMALQYESANNPFTFVEAFLFMWMAWMTWNLWDFMILDWLMIVIWNPKFIRIAEVEHLMHLLNFSFLFQSFLKGCVIITVMSAIAGFILSL
jgi:hypothetical protein